MAFSICNCSQWPGMFTHNHARSPENSLFYDTISRDKNKGSHVHSDMTPSLFSLKRIMQDKRRS